MDSAQEDRKPIVEPRHLSDGQLLALYEAMARQGLSSGTVRAAMLRKKLASATEADRAG